MSDDNEINNEMMNDNKETLPLLSTDPNERMWAMFCHLGTLATWFPFANVIIPMTIWLVKKETSPLVNDQGKEALNFQISMLIGYAICVPLCFVLIGIPAIFALLGLSPIVIHEHFAVTAVTEQGSAKIAHVIGCCDPTGCLRIKLTQLLQVAVLLLCQQRNAHRRSRLDSAAPRFVLFP